MHIAINAQLLNLTDTYRGAGVSKYSQYLLTSLDQMADSGMSDHQFTAFINTPNFVAKSLQLSMTNPILQKPMARIAWEQTLLPRALHKIEADLIHGLVNVLPFRTDIPGVVTVHDLSFMQMPEKFPRAKRFYLARLCRASVHRAAQVIAVSQQTADDLICFFDLDPSRIQVVHHGVDARFVPDVETDEADAIEKFRCQKDLPDRFLLYLGTLEPRKNLALLIKGFARWRAKPDSAAHQDVPLILAGGKGWFYDEIFQLVKELDLTDHIFFPGYIPDAELADWYRAAHLFIYPSLFEGFGFPIIEAMACGTPVLCSQASSLLEVAGDSALTFDPECEDELIDGLTQFMNQPNLCTELRQRGLERAKKFTWQRAAQETLAVYDMV